MKWHQEIRWLIAATLVSWALRLVEREASMKTLENFAVLARNFSSDAIHDIVMMRKPNG